MSQHTLGTIAIFGQGYVGLPLSVAAAEAGYEVIGYDNNQDRVVAINSRLSPTEDVANFQLEKLLSSGNYFATNELNSCRKATIKIICVPTPLDGDDMPDLTLLLVATKSLASVLNKGDLVIIESTIEPFTTREVVYPLLQKYSGLLGTDFMISYSPERIDPKNSIWTLERTPKIVAGLSEQAKEFTKEFYSRFVNNIVTCDSLEIAETAKLLENSFRLVNISLINEFMMFCNKVGIDIQDVIEAASTKPYGFMKFLPGLGAGGHCIPVDPMYISNKARSVGSKISLIELSQRINSKMPSYFANRAKKLLGEVNKKKILVVGIAYKPNVSDTRQSPALELIKEMRKKGAKVFWHDDLVKEWNSEKSSALSSDYDLAILATPHDYLDLIKLGSVPILNTQGSI